MILAKASLRQVFIPRGSKVSAVHLDHSVIVVNQYYRVHEFVEKHYHKKSYEAYN